MIYSHSLLKAQKWHLLVMTEQAEACSEFSGTSVSQFKEQQCWLNKFLHTACLFVPIPMQEHAGLYIVPAVSMN